MDGKSTQAHKYTIGVEEFTWDLFNEAMPLLEAHWEEIAVNKEYIKLKPNYELYFLMQENKNLNCLVARNEGRLVGYLVTLLHVHPHYTDHTFAQNDLFYISPKHRKGMLAIKLIKEQEKQMIRLGVSSITYSVNPKKDFSKLLERSGHTLFETVYRKDLTE
jgi:hypothetical protein